MPGYLSLPFRGVTPPSLESAGFGRRMDGVGSFTIIRLHYPSLTLWEWVLLLLYSVDSGSWATLGCYGSELTPREGC